MPGAGDLLAAGASALPEEFNDPVAYGDRWLWLALLSLVLVAGYYAAVVGLTRDRTAPALAESREGDVPTVRQQHLDRIAHIDAEVRSGRLPPREGHQQLSDTVRSYVGAVSPLPAPTMALVDIRRHAPRPLVEAIELMYPPEFAPDEAGQARERFDEAVVRARDVVATWG